MVMHLKKLVKKTIKEKAKKQLTTQLIYLKIAADIRDSIQSGELAQGDNITPERKIAELYGVSYGTVRKAIQLLVNEELLEKTQGRGTFVRQQTPAARPKKIGVYVPILSMSYYADMVEVIEKIVSDRHYQFFLIRNPEGNQDKLKSFLRHTKLDGLILTHEFSRDKYLAIKKLAPQMKMLFIDGRVTDEEVDYIKCDDKAGAFAATEHLISLGYKDILYIGSEMSALTAINRCDGYEAAMNKWGLKAWIENKGFHYGNGYDCVNKVLSIGNVPEAIFCVNDMVAMGAIQALKDNELRVPDDVAVMGFSNLREAAFNRPAISSVQIDISEISRLAITELLAKVDGKSFNKWQMTFLPHLIIRESSSIKISKKEIKEKMENQFATGILV